MSGMGSASGEGKVHEVKGTNQGYYQEEQGDWWERRKTEVGRVKPRKRCFYGGAFPLLISLPRREGDAVRGLSPKAYAHIVKW